MVERSQAVNAQSAPSWPQLSRSRPLSADAAAESAERTFSRFADCRAVTHGRFHGRIPHSLLMLPSVIRYRPSSNRLVAPDGSGAATGTGFSASSFRSYGSSIK